ncbi:MAG: SurA N-terminal domain-containing protein [Candidatus Woesearchaeota archaeon]
MVKKTKGKKKSVKKTVAKPVKVDKKSSVAAAKKSDDAIQINKSYLVFTGIALLAIIAILLIVVGFSNNGGKSVSSDIAAKVGSEVITVNQLNIEYEKLPPEYKSFVTRRDYLEQVLIPQIILLEAAKDVSDSEIQVVYNDYLFNTGFTEDEIIELLVQQGMTLDEFKDLIKIQIHLNDTIYSKIEVSEEEILEFYEAQVLGFPDDDLPSYEEIRFEIEEFLKGQLAQQAQMDYLENLQTTINVEIMYDDSQDSLNQQIPGSDLSASEGTFLVVGDEVCLEDGKPIIRMFSTSTCPHCTWIKDTFDDLVQEYIDSGDVVGYNWLLDASANSLDPSFTGSIPQSEIQLFQQFNPQGSVPTYVFGCKYMRIGNSGTNDLAFEENEFRNIIELLI